MQFSDFFKQIFKAISELYKKDSETEFRILIILFLIEFDFIAIFNLKLVGCFFTKFTIDIKHPIDSLIFILRNTIDLSDEAIVFLNRIYFFQDIKYCITFLDFY